jgi:hypothetical protein
MSSQYYWRSASAERLAALVSIQFTCGWIGEQHFQMHTLGDALLGKKTGKPDTREEITKPTGRLQ